MQLNKWFEICELIHLKKTVCHEPSVSIARKIHVYRKKIKSIFCHILHWSKKTDQQRPILFLQSLVYTFLVAVFPVTKKLHNKKLSYIAFLKSYRSEILSEWQTSEVYFGSDSLSLSEIKAFSPYHMKNIATHDYSHITT